RYAREAVTLLEGLPRGRELGLAYCRVASACAASANMEEGIEWGKRALALAEQLDDPEIAVNALTRLGALEFTTGGREKLESVLDSELPEQVGNAFVLLGGAAVYFREYALAHRYFEDGIEHCTDH